ncbi:MAG: serine/threonine protein kinase [Candidatus Microthrix sp.]|nr:serine/threonine protein kinase [Candidatus Microthrix sp.]
MSQPVEVLSDRYELHRKLARGGMADVWLARDRVLDRPVAVKIMFAEFATDQLFVERFRREAKSAGNLNHPNIVGVYDWGEQGGTYYIVMEYINGQSVAEVLRAEGPLHRDAPQRLRPTWQRPWGSLMRRGSFTETSSRATSC